MHFKKSLSLVLSLALVVPVLSSCGKDSSDSDASSSATTTTVAGTAQESGESEQFDESSSGSESTGTSGTNGSVFTNTGNLTETGNGYEGIEGTGDYNYGEALQKSLLFYELQRSGDLPDETRCNWRGDSGLDDGSDNGLDLTGGWYDAGDNAKFNLPMAYSAAMLGWSVYEDKDAYEEAGQLEYILGDIKWVTDYLIKCHPEDNVYYYQVGDGNIDHSWWGACEVMTMDRPSFYVDEDNPGSAVTAQAAAALAVAGIIFEDSDPEYSETCLEHAKSLFAFANNTRSDSGYTMANGFYDSHSGFYDELAWAGAWLYIATGDEDFLDTACECYPQASQDYDWAVCWDDVHIAAAVLLAEITGEDLYNNAVQEHLDYWCNDITYTPGGLAWLDAWGPLRYATTTAFVACVYADSDECPAEKVQQYRDFAESQCNYALGSSGRSYVVGFGENSPEHPHHRTSQGSYCDNMNEPSESRHTLYGALVGGPDASDNYIDEVSNYQTNEVACDYNAGFTGLLAKMYSVYHGQTLVDFGAVEPVPSDEYGVDASINVEGDGFIEVKTYVYNMTAWPARAATDVELRYFVDLSEIYDAGYTADDVQITTNYMQSGRVDGLKVWNEENHIYYLSIVFDDGSLYPGGQSRYKSEIQARMIGPDNIWDNSNDYSFTGLGSGSGEYLALYENGELVCGSEPGDEGVNSGERAAGGTSQESDESLIADETESGETHSGNLVSYSGQDGLELSVSLDGNSSNSVSGTIEVKNDTGEDIDLSTVQVVCDTGDNSELVFECYHSAITGSDGSYLAVSGIDADFDGDLCIIGASSGAEFDDEATLTINFSIHPSDWSNLATSITAGDFSLNID